MNPHSPIEKSIVHFLLVKKPACSSRQFWFYVRSTETLVSTVFIFFLFVTLLYWVCFRELYIWPYIRSETPTLPIYKKCCLVNAAVIYNSIV